MRWFRRRKRGRGCLACGICCEMYGHALTATDRDLARWRREGRADLLVRVREDGRLWLDPATGELLEGCPHLRREGAGGARCGIHGTKPEICRAYPTRVHAHRCVRGVRFPET